MVLGADAERFLGVLEEVLLVGRVAPAGHPDLVLDGVQHLDVQQFMLPNSTRRQGSD